MPLQVFEAVDADAARIVAIERDAYALSPLNPIVFPGPFPYDVIARRETELIEMKHEDPTTRWLKVIDSEIPGDSGLVAFACWHIYDPKPVSPFPCEIGSGVNTEVYKLLFSGVNEMQEKVMEGRSYVFLKLLRTDPKHQKRGAGGLLIKWGLEEAARLNLPAYLASSETGHSLYLKHGFVDVAKTEIDLSPWGLDAIHRNWGMVREVSR